MSCHPLVEKGKVVGWACTRGGQPSETCYICGRPAIRLCDYEATDSTCDRPMCSKHSRHAAKDTDYCKEHFEKLDNQQLKLGGY